MTKIMAFASVFFLLAGCSKVKSFENSNANNETGVVDGKLVQLDDPVRRSIVRIVLYVPGEKNGTTCTGTWISKNVILTAAHCVIPDGQVKAEKPENFKVQVGLHPDVYNEVELTVSRVLAHPDYLKDQFQSADIALLQVNGEQPKNTDIARLPKVEDLALVTPENWFVIGYGYTDGILFAEHHQPDYDGVLHWGHPHMVSRLDDRHFMTDQSDGGGAGLCFGDSGGPGLVRSTDGSWIIMGVANNVLDLSPGEDHGKDLCKTYGVYLSVLSQLDWIQKFISEAHSELKSE